MTRNQVAALDGSIALMERSFEQTDVSSVRTFQRASAKAFWSAVGMLDPETGMRIGVAPDLGRETGRAPARQDQGG